MNPAMYIFINRGLGMSPGKMAAQAAHAAVEAYRLSTLRVGAAGGIESGRNIVRHWYKGGHYKKLVMEARDEAHIRTIREYLHERGFRTALIVDEGLTEIAPHQITAIGVELVDKDNPHVEATFSTFSLYRDGRPRKASWLRKLRG